MEHRVGRLQLNIRGPAGQDRDLPRFAEQFSRNVLERFCQIVEDRFPGRDFVIRRMDLRCSLSPEQLIDVAEAVRYAAALAATIVVPDADETIAGVPRANTAEVSGHTETQEQQNQAEPVDPSPAHALDDVVEWILSCLRAEVRGAHDAWVQAWLRDMGSQPVGHFALCQRAITAALAQLDAADAMIETLAALSPRTTWAPARGWLRVSGRRFRLARTRRCRGGQRDRSLPADLAGHRRRAAGPGFPVSAGRFRPLTTFRRPCRHNLMPAAHAPTASAAAALAQVCGSILQLFYTRLMGHDGDAVSDAAGLVSRYLALPGRIVFAPEAMTIVMPMDRIDMALRRAALDRDPGWVPWLQRTVRIEFEPQSPEEVL